MSVCLSVCLALWLFVSPSAYFVGFVEDDEGVFGICFRSHFVVVVVVVVVIVIVIVDVVVVVVVIVVVVVVVVIVVFLVSGVSSFFFFVRSGFPFRDARNLRF